MANYFFWTHRFSAEPTDNDTNPSALVNDISTDNISDIVTSRGAHNGGTLSRRNVMKLGFALVVFSVVIILGMARDGASRNNNNSVHVGETLEAIISSIIGGSETQPLRYQYAVSLQDPSLGHQCGGSLIAPDMVITAAHCKEFLQFAVIGRHNLSSNYGDSIPIKSLTPHTEYNSATFDRDLMLVLLEWPTATDFPLVKLNPDKSSPGVGCSVTVMGWGDMTVNDLTDMPSDVLMSADIHIMSNQDCNLIYNGEITDNMVCATDKGQDSCHGDSGGPLVIQGTSGDGTDSILVGVVSWGVGCGLPDFPGVYARISQSYSWIKDEVCSQSSNPPAYFLCEGTSRGDNRSPTPTSEDKEASEQTVVNSMDIAQGKTSTSSTAFYINEKDTVIEHSLH